MASEKPSRILGSKTDLTSEQIASMSDDDAWKLIYSLAEKNKDDRPQICFTGFGVSRKKELSDIAEEHNFRQVGSVTKNLSFLVCGENSGPKKIASAEDNGATILDEEEFLDLINQDEEKALLNKANTPSHESISKKLKLYKFLSISMVVAGFVYVSMHLHEADSLEASLASMAAFVGTIWYLVNRFLIWRHNSKGG